jgi:hypothetical protein
MGRAIVGRRRSAHIKSAFVCGLDVHRDSTYATILDCNGKIVSRRRMGNDKVLPYLSNYKIDKIGIEASNQIAPLYRLLSKKGYMVSVSHPKKTRYIAEAKIKSDRIKNDRPRLKQCSRCAHTIIQRILAERKRKQASVSTGTMEPPASLYLSLRVTERNNE